MSSWSGKVNLDVSASIYKTAANLRMSKNHSNGSIPLLVERLQIRPDCSLVDVLHDMDCLPTETLPDLHALSAKALVHPLASIGSLHPGLGPLDGIGLVLRVRRVPDQSDALIDLDNVAIQCRWFFDVEVKYARASLIADFEQVFEALGDE